MLLHAALLAANYGYGRDGPQERGKGKMGEKVNERGEIRGYD
jgi:hypothetical protein